MVSLGFVYPTFPSHMVPTIYPADPFNPDADARTLRRALRGRDSDEDAIVDVVAHRTNYQRQEIALHYKEIFGKDLIGKLQRELEGPFLDGVVAAIMPFPEFYATELHDAMEGLGTNENVLTEVMCTLNNSWIHEINAAYEKLYERTLESDIRKETHGNFKRLLVALCQGNRDEDSSVDPGLAESDAQALFEAGEGRWGTDESTFIAVMTSRSFPHLRYVFEHYENMSGTPFEEAVKREFRGNTEDAMLVIVEAVKSTPTFFAKRLFHSLAGAGSKDRALIRVIVTRAECDLEDIKGKYEAKYGTSLKDAVTNDSAGDFKNLLLTMIN